jgi:hypothetical protein
MGQAVHPPARAELLYSLDTWCSLDGTKPVACRLEAIDEGEATIYRHRIGALERLVWIREQPVVRIELWDEATRHWRTTRSAAALLGENLLCFDGIALCVVNPYDLNRIRDRVDRLDQRDRNRMRDRYDDRLDNAPDRWRNDWNDVRGDCATTCATGAPGVGPGPALELGLVRHLGGTPMGLVGDPVGGLGHRHPRHGLGDQRRRGSVPGRQPHHHRGAGQRLHPQLQLHHPHRQRHDQLQRRQRPDHLGADRRLPPGLAQRRRAGQRRPGPAAQRRLPGGLRACR